ncbi:HIT family protein [Flavobacterium ammonificans]|uniref:HIT family protein n=1 Tax=Flavobacterium ammonificans TaxID=1751056 RepID=UPI001E468F9C|nr:HIT family protein [Flavobacterium ammonificans]BDB56322.1 HIT family protein [Flavobacterium ammonificans]
MSVFQQIEPKHYVFETNYFFAIYDRFPVSLGHLLIISKDLKKDYFSLDEKEKNDLNTAIESGKGEIEKQFSPSGYNIGMNCGEDAGQTVMHFHCHIIPRYKGDTKNPRGGIRHCIQGKGYY